MCQTTEVLRHDGDDQDKEGRISYQAFVPGVCGEVALNEINRLIDWLIG